MSDMPEPTTPEAPEQSAAPIAASADPQFYVILGSDGSERRVFGDAGAARARLEALAGFSEGVTFELFDESGAPA